MMFIRDFMAALLTAISSVITGIFLGLENRRAITGLVTAILIIVVIAVGGIIIYFIVISGPGTTTTYP